MGCGASSLGGVKAREDPPKQPAVTLKRLEETTQRVEDNCAALDQQHHEWSAELPQLRQERAAADSQRAELEGKEGQAMQQLSQFDLEAPAQELANRESAHSKMCEAKGEERAAEVLLTAAVRDSDRHKVAHIEQFSDGVVGRIGAIAQGKIDKKMAPLEAAAAPKMKVLQEETTGLEQQASNVQAAAAKDESDIQLQITQARTRREAAEQRRETAQGRSTTAVAEKRVADAELTALPNVSKSNPINLQAQLDVARSDAGKEEMLAKARQHSHNNRGRGSR
jgi:hypothetical protein